MILSSDINHFIPKPFSNASCLLFTCFSVHVSAPYNMVLHTTHLNFFPKSKFNFNILVFFLIKKRKIFPYLSFMALTSIVNVRYSFIILNTYLNSSISALPSFVSFPVLILTFSLLLPDIIHFVFILLIFILDYHKRVESLDFRSLILHFTLFTGQFYCSRKKFK